jgi:DnaJ-like protein
VTERKPAGMSWETWIDRQIREGMERGEFDGLPGHGKPIGGLDRPRDELWWVRDKLRREDVSYLPPALALRKEVEDVRASIPDAPDEAAVRRVVADLNVRIVAANSRVTSGPPSTLVTLDVEREVARWAAAQQAAAEG